MSKHKLAQIIHDMKYGDLIEIGRDLRGMNDPNEKVWDLTSNYDWSAMLHAWAESTLDNDQEE